MHVLVLPSELYVPPRLPLHGIFQRHQAELLAAGGIRTGVVSFGYIPWSQALGRFPYPAVERVNGIDIRRRFVRPAVPGRVASVMLRRAYLANAVLLVRDYVARFGRPDLIHAHNVFNAGLVATRVRAEDGIPFVLTEHSSEFRPATFSRRQRTDALEVFKAASAVTAVSGPLARRMMEIAPSGDVPVEVIGNLLDPWIEQQARETAVSPAVSPRRDFQFVAIGSLLLVKNHDLLLRAFARAFTGDAAVTLRIGGDGPLRSALERQAASLGLGGQVSFLGYLDRTGVVEEIRRADAMVLSSRSETFGVVLIEALAFGKPVIATRCGGPEEIVDAGSGLLVDPEDETFASGLRLLRGGAFDAQAIRRHCLERYGARAFLDRLTRLYGRVAATTPDSAPRADA